MENNTNSNEIQLATNVVKEPALRAAQKRALQFFSDAVEVTYGPMGSYCAYSYGDPGKSTKAIMSNYTKDGFTVLKHLDVDKPIEYLLKSEIRDICTNVIKVIGDGTTSAIMLSNFIFDGLLDLQKTGIPKRLVIKHFKKLIAEAIEKIEANKREATLDDIYNIALTSLNGQKEYAQIIRNIYDENGMNVFIDVSISDNPNTVFKAYSGMTYDTGFIHSCFVNNSAKKTCELHNPDIYVFESPIDTPEMINMVQLIVETNIEKPAKRLKDAIQKGAKNLVPPTPTVIICPHISRDANSYIDSLVNAFSQAPIENRLPLCIVAGITNSNQYLIDIMSLTGAKFIKKYIDPESYKADKEAGLAPTPMNITTFAGHAESVIMDALTTRIINPQNMYDENKIHTTFFKNYIEQLEDLLAKYEETRQEILKIGQLKRRIKILQGNMVDLFVGGIGISDRDSLKDSIEDAVLNCRSAAKEGIGYGANYEGLTVFNAMGIEYQKEKEDLDSAEVNEKYKDNIDNYRQNLLAIQAVLGVITKAYFKLATQLYLPYCDNNIEQATYLVAQSLAATNPKNRCPFNIITGSYDGTVLTSIKTEPAMLEAIAKIISLLFNTTQFLLPDARFNIYEMTEKSSTKVIESKPKNETTN